ncbi:hypothetical protein M3J09_013818 [Ascochyta lentis]
MLVVVTSRPTRPITNNATFTATQSTISSKPRHKLIKQMQQADHLSSDSLIMIISTQQLLQRGPRHMLQAP